MAGGPLAQVVACWTCEARAERVYEGSEDDRYLCVNGHEFGIDWSRTGPATEPQWVEEAPAATSSTDGKTKPET